MGGYVRVIEARIIEARAWRWVGVGRCREWLACRVRIPARFMSPGRHTRLVVYSDWFVSGFCLFLTRFRALHQWFRHKYLTEASHTKRSRRWERLQWFSALKSKKNSRFCSKSGFWSILADIGDFAVSIIDIERSDEHPMGAHRKSLRKPSQHA